MHARNFRDLTSVRFGRLVVLGFAGKYRDTQSQWLCRCDCGEEKVLRGCSLTTGHIRSCGCLRSADVPAGSGVERRPRRDRIDHAGERFGRLVVTSYEGRGRWVCRCDCGQEKIVNGGALRSGDTRSCGCLHDANAITHGLAKSAEYRIWVGIIQRCRNPKSNGYALYGGRGVDICSRWAASFKAFHDDIGDRPSPVHSLDRIDNDKGYEPGNVRWATPTEQQRNRRDNVTLTLDGRTMTIDEWAEETGIGKQTIRARLRYGWNHDRVLTEPVRPSKQKGV